MENPGTTEDVVAVETRWRPSKLSTHPVLFQDLDRAVLIFGAGRDSLVEGLKTTLKRGLGPTDDLSGGGQKRIEIRFEDCLIARFGYPGFAALSGHPLHDQGLNDYGLFEVRGSSWAGELADHDKIAFPKERWPPFPVRHFVAIFKDALFECLCGSVRGRATSMPVAAILEQLG